MESSSLYQSLKVIGGSAIQLKQDSPPGNEWGDETKIESKGFKVPENTSGAGATLLSSPLPKVFSLSQNYPNPFNPSTTIEYAIPEGAGEGVRAQVSIYDLRGRLVRTLVDEEQGPGYYRVHWDGKAESGERVGSGVYLYTIRAGSFHGRRKMILVR